MQVEQKMHSILRLDNENEPIPPKEQTIGSFAGFQARIQSKPQKSKPYYFLTLPTAPQKSEVHEVMSHLADVIKEGRMPFVQLVGDQPVSALIAQLPSANRKTFEKISPILGPFHTQCSFIAAINKRFSGSGLSEILVSACMIAAKSVESALKPKHFRRAVRRRQLVYEALQRRLIQIGVFKGIHLPEELKQQLATILNPSVSSQEQLPCALKAIRDPPSFASFVERVYKVVESKGNSMVNYCLALWR